MTTKSPVTKPVAPTRPASTVLLLRDGEAGMEVFMVVRHHQIDFASGALVFPGGSVETEDASPEIRARCRGAEGLDDVELSFRVAAVREAFEECGVLLARPRGEENLISAERLEALETDYRKALDTDEIGMATFAEREDLELALDLLVPFAHWITPVGMPKRFDTHFFAAKAPIDHVLLHDGHEAVDSVWITPAQAIADADADKRTVIFPTRMNLLKLGRSDNCASALARARREPVVTVLPHVERTDTGRVMHIPEEAGYGISQVALEGAPGKNAKLAQPLAD